MIFSAAFTVRCRLWQQEMVLAPYHTVIQLVRTLDGASAERVDAGGRGSRSSQFPQKVETLLCFFGQRKVNLIANPCFLCAAHSCTMSQWYCSLIKRTAVFARHQ